MNNNKICVVGAGNWGFNHVRTLNKIGASIGIVDQNQNINHKLEEQKIKADFFLNLDDAIDFGYDGFIVATPAITHFEIAKKIINSKNHVLIEKPITTDLSSAKELNDLAKKNNVNLMVGHLLLFHPAFTKLKSIIRSGKLGDLQYVYSNRLNHGTIRSEENVLWSFAPHDIALFQFLIGSFPLNVESRGIDLIQPNIHDTTITIFKYPNKVMSHIFVSWLHPFKEHRFIVIGSKGMIHFEDSIKDKKSLLFYDKNVKWDNDMPIAKSSSSIEIPFDKTSPLELELRYFIEHLNGKSLELCSGDSAVENMKILSMASNTLMQE